MSLSSSLKVCATCAVRTTKLVRQFCGNAEFSKENDDISRFPEWMGAVEYETRSNFSHIRVRHRGPIRSLIFVEPSGTEQFESSVDMRNLHVPYASYLINSLSTLLLNPAPDRVLILGLGGGSMLHFYQKYFSNTYLDIVEIDAAVVDVAKQFFNVKENSITKIFTMDAFDFLAKSTNRYHAIYVDAFLNTKLTERADEITSRLKHPRFLLTLRSHLSENGSVAFNLLKSSGTYKRDLHMLTDIFPSVYSISSPESGNLAALASLDENSFKEEFLQSQAEKLDRKIALYFSFKQVASLMKTVY